MVVENKARIFKVLKTPVDTQESLPSVAKEILGWTPRVPTRQALERTFDWYTRKLERDVS